MFSMVVLAMSGRGDDDGVCRPSAGFHRSENASFWDSRGGMMILRGGEQQNPRSGQTDFSPTRDVSARR
jgi:hypothetical protein